MRLATPRVSRLARQLLLFVLVFAGLQAGWEALRGSPIEYGLIHHATVVPSTWLVNTLTPEVQAVAVDSSIRSRQGSLNIRNGCEGLEALFLLCAALVAAHASIRQRCV